MKNHSFSQLCRAGKTQNVILAEPALMLAPCFPMTRAPAVARTIIRQGGTMAGMLPPSVPPVPLSTSGWEPPGGSASAIPLIASLTSLEAG